MHKRSCTLILHATAWTITATVVEAFHTSLSYLSRHKSLNRHHRIASTTSLPVQVHPSKPGKRRTRSFHHTTPDDVTYSNEHVESRAQDAISFPNAVTRDKAIGIALSAMVALTSARPVKAIDPIKKTQEAYRIWRQEEADNILGGGELASPEGGKTLQPVLALIPIITLRLRLDMVETSLKDPRRFREGLDILQSQDFQKKDIKRVFNAYSDNIYYLPDSERENKYLQGGATPSSRQTLQYLLRNDVIDNVEALAAEIAYLIREREESEAEGLGSPYDSDEKDLRMYLDKCKSGFDRYLGMVLQNEIDEATEYAKMALARTKSK